MRNLTFIFLLTGLIILTGSHLGCGSFGGAPDQPDSTLSMQVKLVEAYPELSFTRPVDFTHAGDGSGRVFVVVQRGIIYVFPNQETTEEKQVLLDISAKVDDNGNEEGLLGLAFHPNFAQNGFFYVNYTTSESKTHISRFHIPTASPNQADPASEVLLLSFDQPYGNHNGGGMVFGPDGYLYIGVGDGGSAGDPKGNGQNLSTLLASVLRISVDERENGKEYAIPADNPFAGNQQGYREEIFAYGLRNPWRISFDAKTGKLWTGDVGQNAWEEVDIVEKGGNYGWKIMEGNDCFKSNNCDKSQYLAPVIQYDRDQGYSITGGFVYRGQKIPDLVGKYVYTDYVSGRLWVLNADRLDQPDAKLLKHDRDLQISSFGLDENQEIFVCSFDGKIYKFVKS